MKMEQHRCCRAGPAAPLSPAASFAYRSAAELRSDPRNSTAPHRTAQLRSAAGRPAPSAQGGAPYEGQRAVAERTFLVPVFPPAGCGVVTGAQNATSADPRLPPSG